jgi:hypothetical protein
MSPRGARAVDGTEFVRPVRMAADGPTSGVSKAQWATCRREVVEGRGGLAQPRSIPATHDAGTRFSKYRLI